MRLEVWRSGLNWRCEKAPSCSTTRPHSSDASAELRTLQIQAQTDFNRLWERAERNYATIGGIWKVVLTVRKKARERAYAWLAQQLGVDAAELHIGMLSPEDCRRVITACRSTSDKAIREWAKNETTGATR